MRAIECLRESHPSVKQHVTFSLAFSRNHQHESDWTFLNGTCDTIDEDLERFSSSSENFFRIRVPYPVGLMRNLARKSSRTHFFTVCDIDVTPSMGIRTGFLQMVTKKGLLNEEKSLYIMPIFELKRGELMPKDKAELKTLVQKGTARQFHITSSPIAHVRNSELFQLISFFDRNHASVCAVRAYIPSYVYVISASPSLSFSCVFVFAYVL